MVRVALGLALVLALACSDGKAPAASAEAKPVELATPGVAPPPASTEPTVIPATPLPAVELPTVAAHGRMVFDPPSSGDGKLPHDPLAEVDPDVGTMANHLQEFGWSADSKTFMACGDSGSEHRGPCIFVEVGGGKSETLWADHPRFAKRMAAGPFAKGPTRWRYGDEITFTWSAQNMDLQFGGKLDSGRGKHDVLTWRFDAEQFDGGEVYPEVVSVSPDGELLAVVGHASLGEVDDEWTPRMIDVDEFAAQVYARVAFDHLQAQAYAEAETLFARAAAVDGHWKHPYNLACTRARAGSKDVEPALRLAIERGGDPVKAKAKADKDLHAVRNEPWFAELIGD